jgi:four helix bundle protein
VGANYIEANEALSKKDFIYRIKLCRKEAKETTYWIKLIEVISKFEIEKNNLIKESIELTNIFGAIYRKTSHD